MTLDQNSIIKPFKLRAILIRPVCVAASSWSSYVPDAGQPIRDRNDPPLDTS